jgi:hypothetical protein
VNANPKGDTGTAHTTSKLSGLDNTLRQPTESECFAELIKYLASIAKV